MGKKAKRCAQLALALLVALSPVILRDSSHKSTLASTTIEALLDGLAEDSSEFLSGALLGDALSDPAFVNGGPEFLSYVSEDIDADRGSERVDASPQYVDAEPPTSTNSQWAATADFGSTPSLRGSAHAISLLQPMSEPSRSDPLSEQGLADSGPELLAYVSDDSTDGVTGAEPPTAANSGWPGSGGLSSGSTPAVGRQNPRIDLANGGAPVVEEPRPGENARPGVSNPGSVPIASVPPINTPLMQTPSDAALGPEPIIVATHVPSRSDRPSEGNRTPNPTPWHWPGDGGSPGSLQGPSPLPEDGPPDASNMGEEKIGPILASLGVVDPIGSLAAGGGKPLPPVEALIVPDIGLVPFDGLETPPATANVKAVRPSQIPEPGGLALLGLGLVALGLARRAS